MLQWCGPERGRRGWDVEEARAGSPRRWAGHEEWLDGLLVEDVVLEHNLEVAHERGVAPPQPSLVLPVRAVLVLLHKVRWIAFWYSILSMLTARTTLERWRPCMLEF